jgi:hypothetical protein
MLRLDKTFSKKAETLLYHYDLELLRLREYYSGLELAKEFIRARKKTVQRLRKLIARNAWS